MNDIVTFEQDDPIAITTSGLDIAADATRDDFIQFGQKLAQAREALGWCVGDWYNAVPGDKKEACQLSGLDYGNARKCGAICRTYPVEARVDGLSFYHHQIAAPLDNREELLVQAAAEDWSGRRLQQEVGQHKPIQRRKTEKDKQKARAAAIAAVRAWLAAENVADKLAAKVFLDVFTRDVQQSFPEPERPKTVRVTNVRTETINLTPPAGALRPVADLEQQLAALDALEKEAEQADPECMERIVREHAKLARATGAAILKERAERRIDKHRADARKGDATAFVTEMSKLAEDQE